jgi:hypothetical protein
VARPAPAELAVQAEREVAGMFARHAALLRSVVLISGVHPEVDRRGSLYSRELGDAFTALLLREGAGTGQPNPEAAVRAAFNAVHPAKSVIDAPSRLSPALPELQRAPAQVKWHAADTRHPSSSRS